MQDFKKRWNNNSQPQINYEWVRIVLLQSLQREQSSTIFFSRLKDSTEVTIADPIPSVPTIKMASGNVAPIGSYVVSQDIYWCETIYGKCLHKRTNQRLNHYMCRGVTGNTTYLGRTVTFGVVQLYLLSRCTLRLIKLRVWAFHVTCFQ